MDQNSFRSELMGIFGILTCVAAIQQAFHFDRGSLTIALDGKSAINTITKPYPLQSHQQSLDILQCIRILSSSLTNKWKWAEGHQIEKYHLQLSDLDWWGRANEGVDNLAKHHLTHHMANPRSSANRIWWVEEFAVLHEGVKLAKLDFNNFLYADLTLVVICEYSQSKHHDISWDVIDSIDWQSTARSSIGNPTLTREICVWPLWCRANGETAEASNP